MQRLYAAQTPLSLPAWRDEQHGSCSERNLSCPRRDFSLATNGCLGLKHRRKHRRMMHSRRRFPCFLRRLLPKHSEAPVASALSASGQSTMQHQLVSSRATRYPGQLHSHIAENCGLPRQVDLPFRGAVLDALLNWTSSVIRLPIQLPGSREAEE